ncbi:MAG: cofactor-independent phosphoglycerate mutase [Deltaproteobacteria bacterium]|nr:cofactor-independent phosphoglycerate mutase [Deltaproteobacteria bacterium]
MKYVIILGDGMADEPIEALGNKTPLEFACTPHMDRMATRGTLGLIDTILPGLPLGSDVANLAVLGYDPRICYTGRGPLEAASMGVVLAPEDIAFRCNLVTLGEGDDPRMEDFTAGHISSTEAKQIISDLGKGIGSDSFIFYPGVGYRHLMVWRGGSDEVEATPPHDIIGRATGPYLPQGQNSEPIRRLMRSSREFLSNHPLNLDRRARGLKPATSIWLWGQGRAPKMRKITERFHLRGGMISAVDLLNGIGIYAGLEILTVVGATGYTDTNYIGKAEMALTALSEFDLVFLHVEAPDEMGHEGNLAGKIKAIEDLDEKVVGTILKEISHFGEYRVAVMSDHPTPICLRTHAGDPSPIAVLSSKDEENQNSRIPFGERAARRSGILISPGFRFMESFLGSGRPFS